MNNIFFSDGLERKIRKLLNKIETPSRNGKNNLRYSIFMDTIENYNELKKNFEDTTHPQTAKYRMLITAFNNVETKYNGKQEPTKIIPTNTKNYH